MKRVFAAVVLAVLVLAHAAAPSAQGLPEPADAAENALKNVCRPAVEKSIAPRDLAEPLGFRRDLSPAAAVEKLFPMTQIGSASYGKEVNGGTIHVVSTVVPPPANPFSCLVELDVDAPGLVDRIKAAFSGPGSRYVYMPQASKGSPTDKVYIVALDAEDEKAKTDDKIMAFAARDQRPDQIHAFILVYRVDAAGYLAAQELKLACQAGSAPVQLCSK